ncbi:lytic murein transglycosylase B [uncultured Thiohalocapsa sp.]|uniref:lytic murein transglycosylase B n=1 Tax=uncultured Thiohalocapsa sp. TaxID=768990 RepID=UPI0025FBF1CA|nr:lytic murein transglycosylase B [uncultured Thiohalocapsa sp.]
MRPSPFRIITILLLLPLAACGSNPTADAPQARLASAHGSAAQAPVRFSSSPRLTSGPYAGRGDVERFIDRMQAKGYTRAELVGIFSRVRPDDWIIEYMNRQWRPSPGPNGAWTRYRARHITPAMLSRGTAFWSQHAAELERASRKYGVPPEYIVAIIGIETKWGGYMGKHRIIDALATLAFDYPRRAEYFTDELENYLVMARQEGFDPFQPVGSFAGAMGYGQFMPSSYLKYAVDFDGNGRRDLWDKEDAIGSVAHYFQQHGWRSGEPVTVQATGGAGLPESMDVGFKSRYRVRDLTARGVRPSLALPDDKQVSLLRLDAAGGYEYWIGLDNFQTITKYNRSTYYAMTVHQLAQALKAPARRQRALCGGARRPGGTGPRRLTTSPARLTPARRTRVTAGSGLRSCPAP